MNPSLAAALKARDEEQAAITAIDKRNEKLSLLSQSASPAVSELNALHSDHQVALARYADSEDGTPPVFDAALAARLKAEIAAHQDSINSANAAIAMVQAQRARHVETQKAASMAAAFHAAVEIAEAGQPELIAAVNAAWVTLAAAKGKLDGLTSFLRAEGAKRPDFALHSVADRLLADAEKMLRRSEAVADASPFYAKLHEMTAPKGAA